MKKSSKHHVLPPFVQKENDKAAIRNIIEAYDIDDAIDVLYNTLKEIRSYSDNIDKCVANIEDEFNESRKISTDE